MPGHIRKRLVAEATAENTEIQNLPFILWSQVTPAPGKYHEGFQSRSLNGALKL